MLSKSWQICDSDRFWVIAERTLVKYVVAKGRRCTANRDYECWHGESCIVLVDYARTNFDDHFKFIAKRRITGASKVVRHFYFTANSDRVATNQSEVGIGNDRKVAGQLIMGDKGR